MNFYSALLPHVPKLTKADMSVYLALGDLAADNDAYCIAWQDEIAAKAGVSLRQVKRSLTHLESAGLITIDRSKRYHRVFHFTYAKPALQDAATDKASLLEETSLSPRKDAPPSNTLNTTESNNLADKKQQLVLVENDNLQNLGQLDIDAQKSLADLAINPNLTQPFPTAPALIQRHTPAEILIAYDPTDRIADNLASWAAAHRNGEANLNGLTPALIWCKIVEGQKPPQAKPSLAAEIAANNAKLNAEASERPFVADSAPFEADIAKPKTNGAQNAPESVLETPEPEPNPLAVLWNDTLSILAGQMTRAAFTSYLAATRLQRVEGNVYTVTAPPLAADWLAYRFRRPIERTLAAVAGNESATLIVV